jgi:hypothetical protein
LGHGLRHTLEWAFDKGHSRPNSPAAKAVATTSNAEKAEFFSGLIGKRSLKSLYYRSFPEGGMIATKPT